MTDDGTAYHYNVKTGESIWEHPLDESYRQKFQQEKAKAINTQSAKKAAPVEAKKPEVKADKTPAKGAATPSTAKAKNKEEDWFDDIKNDMTPGGDDIHSDDDDFNAKHFISSLSKSGGGSSKSDIKKTSSSSSSITTAAKSSAKSTGSAKHDDDEFSFEDVGGTKGKTVTTTATATAPEDKLKARLAKLNGDPDPASSSSSSSITAAVSTSGSKSASSSTSTTSSTQQKKKDVKKPATKKNDMFGGSAFLDLSDSDDDSQLLDNPAVIQNVTATYKKEEASIKAAAKESTVKVTNKATLDDILDIAPVKSKPTITDNKATPSGSIAKDDVVTKSAKKSTNESAVSSGGGDVLHAMISQLQADNLQLRRDLSKAADSGAAAKLDSKEMDALKGEIAGLKEQLTAEKARGVESTSLLESMRIKLHNSENQIMLMETKAIDMNRIVDELNKKLKVLSDEKDAVSEALASNRGLTASDIASRVQEERVRIRNEMECMIESERKRAEVAEAEALKLSILTKQLQSKESSAGRELAIMKETLHKLQDISNETATKAEDKCLNMQAKLNVAVEERESIRTQLIDAQEQIHNLKNGENARLVVDLDRMKRENSMLRNTIEEERSKYIQRETSYRDEKDQAIRDRVSLLERTFEERARDLAAERVKLMTSLDNDKKLFDKQRQTFEADSRKQEIEGKVLVDSLKSKLSAAESERDALSKEQYEVLERYTVAEAMLARETQLRRESERNFEKEKNETKMLRQRLVDARADVRVVELEKLVASLQEKCAFAEEEVNMVKAQTAREIKSVKESMKSNVEKAAIDVAKKVSEEWKQRADEMVGDIAAEASKFKSMMLEAQDRAVYENGRYLNLERDAATERLYLEETIEALKNRLGESQFFFKSRDNMNFDMRPTHHTGGGSAMAMGMGMDMRPNRMSGMGNFYPVSGAMQANDNMNEMEEIQVFNGLQSQIDAARREAQAIILTSSPNKRDDSYESLSNSPKYQSLATSHIRAPVVEVVDDIFDDDDELIKSLRESTLKRSIKINELHSESDRLLRGAVSPVRSSVTPSQTIKNSPLTFARSAKNVEVLEALRGSNSMWYQSGYWRNKYSTYTSTSDRGSDASFLANYS